MKMLTRISSAILLLSLTACVSMQKEVKDEQWTYTPNPTTGAVLVSIVEEAPNPEVKSCLCPSIFYRDAGSKKNNGFLHPCEGMSCNFQNGDFTNAHGELYLLELPVGNYEFYNYSINISTGVSEGEITAKNAFSMPFSVQAGKVKYVGEAKLKDVMGKNAFGMSVPAGEIPSVSDQHVRDFATAKKKFPKLPLEQVVIDVKPFAGK